MPHPNQQQLNQALSGRRYLTKDVDNAILAAGSQAATPIFAPMGIDEDNWPAVVGLFTGLLAKEVMVGSLGAIYSKSVEAEDVTVGAELVSALQSITANAADLTDALLDPLGLSLTAVDEVENMPENQGVSTQLFGILQDKFSSVSNGSGLYHRQLFLSNRDVH